MAHVSSARPHPVVHTHSESIAFSPGSGLVYVENAVCHFMAIRGGANANCPPGSMRRELQLGTNLSDCGDCCLSACLGSYERTEAPDSSFSWQRRALHMNFYIIYGHA